MIPRRDVGRWVCAVTVALCGFAAEGCGKATGTAPTPVSQVSLTALLISSAPTSPIIGGSYQLTASASFSDGSVLDVSTQASWSSSNTGAAIISGTGLLSIVGAGDFEIHATFSSVAASRSFSVPLTPPLTCGVERWAVKTLSDSDANRVDIRAVQPVSIRFLNDLPTHCSGIPDGRTFATEFQTYEVTGRVIVLRKEDDRDYHLALSDPDDSTSTIVTEIADVACFGAASSPFHSELGSARAQIDAIIGGRSLSSLNGSLLKVRGVGFYDFNHGQTGRSRSCIELHPVVLVEQVK